MSADFWAGYISGAAGIIIGNPLDLIKTRLQAGKAPSAQNVEAIVGATATTGPLPPQQSLQGFKAHFENAGTLVRGEKRYLSSNILIHSLIYTNIPTFHLYS